MTTPYEVFSEEEMIGMKIDPEDVPGDSHSDYQEPDETIIKEKPKSRTHKEYEKKVRGGLATAFNILASRESTVPDAAAIIMHGPEFADKAGALADHDARFRRAIDMLSEGSENPYIAFAAAAIPMGLQVYRNHKDILQPSVIASTIKQNRAEAKARPPRKIRIPFTKKYLEVRLQFQLPSVEAVTNPPEALSNYVFSQPAVQEMIKKQEIKLAWKPPSGNGRGNHAR